MRPPLRLGRLARALCLVLLGMGLAACDGARSLPGPSQGVLRIALDSRPTNLDPRFALDANSSRIAQLIFNGLVRYDERSRVAPDLALSWEQPSPTTFIFHLRPGVRFHDGRPLTAEDVVYTYTSLLDPELASPKRGSYRGLQEVTALDSLTVRFTLSAYEAPFLGNLSLGILPRPAPAGDARAREGMRTFPPHADQRQLIGTGPFRFARWVGDDALELRANRDSFEGPPKLAGLLFRVIPEQTVSVLELENGGIDLIQNEVAPDLLPRLRRNPALRVVTGPGTNYSYFGFNFTDPILRRWEVRAAIAHAIDRRSIIRHLLRGLAEPATGLLSPLNWAYDGEVATYPYDPARARALLDAAGFPDPDGAGPAPRFRLHYKTTQNDLRQRIALVLQEELAEIGIELQVRFFEWGTFFADIARGNFQLYTLTWVGVRDPDIYYYTMHSASEPPQGANRGRYRSAPLDLLLERGRAAGTLEERRAIYSEVQRLVAAELPYVSLWYSTNIAVMRTTVQGFRLHPAGDFMSLREVELRAD
ncbi:MAG: ABC transporter substrate-binding protein [Candidatus Tectomicrobia bacterium]|nr:ABC transporter substrate-binding protein [Candidatus Tectomicrobia bacterium]